MVSYSTRGGGVEVLFTLPSPTGLGKSCRGAMKMPKRLTTTVKHGNIFERGNGEFWFCIGSSIVRSYIGLDCLPSGNRLKEVTWTDDLGVVPLIKGFELSPWGIGVPGATSKVVIGGESNSKVGGKWILMGTKRGTVFCYDKSTQELIHTVEIIEENGSGPPVTAIEVLSLPKEASEGIDDLDTSKIEVRQSEERSDELAAISLVTKTARARTSVQNTPPP